MSLTYPSVDFSWSGLDFASCGCSSKCCISSIGFPYRKLSQQGDRLFRQRKSFHCGVSSVQRPDVMLNVKEEDVALSFNPDVKFDKRVSMSSLLAAVADDLRMLNENLQSIVGAENPMLMSAAEQIFGAGGKRMRPALVFLVSRATSQMTGLKDVRPQHRRLAEIIEMIHTASLIHDDVLDESSMRRGKETIHQLYGTRVAVLAGDFMFAQSSWYLANLENIEVIKLISQVIKDFASGEIKQASSLFDCDLALEDYLLKSYYKTASLIAASTKSAAIFSSVGERVCDEMYNYGKNLGLSFQIVDDILDFTQSSEKLGKPAASDLAKGNLTAPVLFALKKEPKLREIIESEFTEMGSLELAIELVYKGGGIERARDLAKQKADLAIQSLNCLPQNELRSSLAGMVKYALERLD
ncbi:putative solanesyl-diphosphate synthase 3 [Nymphaea thermarum]|nr:putative solanesyl-diphosphate synthase 3 [Nymphaea thermarum]